jgi:hypothetical protein
MSANRGFAKTKIFDFWHITKIVQNSNFTNLHKEYNEGKLIENIAEYYGLDNGEAEIILFISYLYSAGHRKRSVML